MANAAYPVIKQNWPYSGPTLLFSDDFNTLSIAGQSNPNGNWMPKDFAWQPQTQGYQDFAGTNWNLNPNDSNAVPYNPFWVSRGSLTISSFRTPSSIAAAIANENAAHGVSNTTPAWCGGFMISRVSFANSYTEWRARWPNTGKGMFPALWFYASQLLALSNEVTAEIDLQEMYEAPNSFYTSTHTTNSTQTWRTIDTSQWPTYAVDRQAGWVRCYLAGVLSETLSAYDTAYINTVPMQLHMNYAMYAY